MLASPWLSSPFPSGLLPQPRGASPLCCQRGHGLSPAGKCCPRQRCPQRCQHHRSAEDRSCQASPSPAPENTFVFTAQHTCRARHFGHIFQGFLDPVSKEKSPQTRAHSLWGIMLPPLYFTLPIQVVVSVRKLKHKSTQNYLIKTSFI